MESQRGGGDASFAEARSAGWPIELERLYVLHASQIRSRLIRKFARGGQRSVLWTEDVEDAIQEIFARLLDSPVVEVNGSACRSLPAYVSVTVRNLCLDVLRARRREEAATQKAARSESLDGEGGALTGEHDDPSSDAERIETVREYLCGLPVELFRFFEVRFVIGLSQRKCGESLGLTRRRTRTLERRLLTGLTQRLMERGMRP